MSELAAFTEYIHSLNVEMFVLCQRSVEEGCLSVSYTFFKYKYQIHNIYKRAHTSSIY